MDYFLRLQQTSLCKADLVIRTSISTVRWEYHQGSSWATKGLNTLKRQFDERNITQLFTYCLEKVGWKVWWEGNCHCSLKNHCHQSSDRVLKARHLKSVNSHQPEFIMKVSHFTTLFYNEQKLHAKITFMEASHWSEMGLNHRSIMPVATCANVGFVG